MNFSFEEYKGHYPDALVKHFSSTSDAKKYCLSDDACVGVKDNDALISVDEIEDSEDVFLRKRENNLLTRENIDQLQSENEDTRSLVMSLVEKDARCVLVIYKCQSEIDKISLNFDNSELYCVIFMESSGFEINKLPVEKGLYIVRQIFFIESEEDKTQEYSVVFSNSQFVTYLDGIMVKRSWTQGNNVYVHSVNLKISKGIHSITNDFSFDTDSMYVDLGESELSEIFVMPTLDKELIEPYENNPLFYSTRSIIESKKFEECSAEKLTEDRCLNRLRTGTTSKDRMLVNSYEINKDILPFIEYVYTHNDIDIDLSKDIKKTVEAYLISKFSNLDFSDMETILFLVKFIDSLVKEKLLTQEVLDSCVDESSDIFKSGVCRDLETSLPNSDEIKNTILRRNYIYCMLPDGDNFMFDKKEERCDMVTDEEKTAAMVSKCEEYKDDKYCKELSMVNEEVRLKRNIYIDGILSTKEGLATLAKDYSTEFGKAMKYLDSTYDKLIKCQKAAESANLLLSKKNETQDQTMQEILEMSARLSEAELVTAQNDNQEAKRLYEIARQTFPEEEEKENERKRVLNYIATEYFKDRTLSEFITDLYENGECVGCSELYDELQDQPGDNSNIVKYSRKIKMRNEGGDGLFSLDPEDVIINSNEVLKFCKQDPFNSKCVDYYKGIYENKSGFVGSKIPIVITTSWLELIILFILFIVFVTLLVIFLTPEKDYYDNEYNKEY